MTASIDDLLTNAGEFEAEADGFPVKAVVAAERKPHADTLVCESLKGWTKETAVHFSVYDPEDKENTQVDYKGIVGEDNTITNLKRIMGNEDRGNKVGDIAVLNPTYGWVADLVKGLLKTHGVDGGLKDKIVEGKNLADSSVSTDKLQSSSVGKDQLGATALELINGKQNALSGAVKTNGITWVTYPGTNMTFQKSDFRTYNGTSYAPKAVGDIYLAKMYTNCLALCKVTELSEDGNGKAQVITYATFDVMKGAQAGVTIKLYNESACSTEATGLTYRNYFIPAEIANTFKTPLTSFAADMGKIFLANYTDNDENKIGLFYYNQSEADGALNVTHLSSVTLPSGTAEVAEYTNEEWKQLGFKGEITDV